QEVIGSANVGGVERCYRISRHVYVAYKLINKSATFLIEVKLHRSRLSFSLNGINLLEHHSHHDHQHGNTDDKLDQRKSSPIPLFARCKCRVSRHTQLPLNA